MTRATDSGWNPWSCTVSVAPALGRETAIILYDNVVLTHGQRGWPRSWGRAIVRDGQKEARWAKRPGTGADRWALRSVPESQARRYVAEGWWNDATLGATVAEGLAHLGAETFQVHSKVRPWAGTFADVDRAARALAGALRARGVGPGSVVVLQLPNWVEAARHVLGRGLRGRRRDPDRPLLRRQGGGVHPRGDVARRGGHHRPLRPQRLPGGVHRTAAAPPRPAVAGGGRRAAPSATSRRRRPRSSRCWTGTRSPPPPPSTPTHRRSSASRRARRATPRAWCTPTARSGARPASWTTCSPRAVPRGSPVRPWGTSSGCSTRS